VKLAVSDVFHTGFVVDDIHRGMEELGAAFDVAWAPLTEITMRLRTPAGPIEPDMAFTYSVEGPHHIELLKAVPGTPWTVAASDGPVPLRSAHHIGIWSDDVPGDSARLTETGAELVVTYDTGDGRVAGFAYHRLATGVLLELVDRRRQPEFERWFAGGSFVTGA
jgi:hypothetical protein